MKRFLLPRRSFAAVTLVSLACATALQGEIKNFAFAGTITTVADLNFILDDSVTNGVPFEGFYVFDTDTPDTNPDTTVGDYWHTKSAFGVVIKVGSYVFRTNPKHVNFLIEVVDRPTSDNYLLRSYNNVSSLPVEHIEWQLDDPSGNALTNDLLPTVPPPLERYESWFGVTISGYCDTFLIRGTVESIREVPAVIPDPPENTIEDAVEVRWISRLGYFYQVQQSERMDEWTNVGEPVLGDGTELSRFFRRERGRKVFYRVEIANFAE